MNTWKRCKIKTYFHLFILFSPTHNVNPLIIIPEMVENILNGLDAYSSIREGGIHPKLLKLLSSKLAIPLCITFNNSFQTGWLPDSWLRSNIVPIFNKSSRYDPLNYRAISLSSGVCKTMERVVMGHLMLIIFFLMSNMGSVQFANMWSVTD